MTFTLDTSGYVIEQPKPGYTATVHHFWRDRTPFEQGYIAAMLESVGQRRFDRIEWPTLARIIEDCESIVLDDEDDTESGNHAWKVRQAGRWPSKWPALTVTLRDDGKVVFS